MRNYKKRTLALILSSAMAAGINSEPIVEKIEYISKKNSNENSVSTNYSNAAYGAVTSDDTQYSEPVLNIPPPNSVQHNEFDMHNAFPFIIGVLIIFTGLVLLYKNGKTKMNEVTGESFDYDFSDDTEEKKSKTSKNKSRTKNKISNGKIEFGSINMITGTVNKPEIDEKVNTPTPDKTISQTTVDLDKLFNEKKAQNDNNKTSNNKANDNEPEEDDLAEFLNDFSFEDKIEKQGLEEKHAETLYNEELYNKIIENPSLSFSKQDFKKLKELMNLELSDEILETVKNYTSNPVTPHKPTKQEILENFITTYTIERNIIFTPKDVEALNKLISVEIDSDFINDLRINPRNVQTVSKEIERQKEELYQPEEIKILKVSQSIPNLESEIKKAGGKNAIINGSAKNVNKDEENTYKGVKLVLDGYDVPKLNVTNDFPELKDIKNYTEPQQEIVHKDPKIDEEILLNNITNVTFKPFYDEENDVLTYEISAADNTEIVEEYPDENNTAWNQATKQKKHSEKYSKQIDSDAKKLLELIESKKALQKQSKEKLEQARNEVIEEITKEKTGTKTQIEECCVDGEKYKILSSYNLGANKGFYLGKNSLGYTVIGYIQNEFFAINKYDDLKNTKIQARKSETLENGVEQYIIRLGIKKFIVNVSEEKMEFIMELC